MRCGFCKLLPAAGGAVLGLQPPEHFSSGAGDPHFSLGRPGGFPTPGGHPRPEHSPRLAGPAPDLSKPATGDRRPRPPPCAPDERGSGRPARQRLPASLPVHLPVRASVGLSIAPASPPGVRVWAPGPADPGGRHQPLARHSPAPRGMSSCPTAARRRLHGANPALTRAARSLSALGCATTHALRAEPTVAGHSGGCSLLGPLGGRGGGVCKPLDPAYQALFETDPAPSSGRRGGRCDLRSPVLAWRGPLGLSSALQPEELGEYWGGSVVRLRDRRCRAVGRSGLLDIHFLNI